MTATPTPPPDPSLVSHMDALPAGTRLGEFELTGLLGVGGFGMVYCAWDHSLERNVAIKEYMPAALAGRSKGPAVSMRSATDEQTFLAGLKSFVAEAKLLARFDHPSLVKVYRFWEQNNTAYMAMPLYQGITLKQARTQMRCPPPEAWLRKVIASVLDALKVLHDAGTMHRDVSPDNIFLQDLGPPVLLDLGAARRAIHDRSHKHTAILKVNYAPIEQYADSTDLQQGAWTDLYALGAVIHGSLCNEPPLPSTFRVIRDRLTPMADVARTVEEHFGLAYSVGFVSAIQRALAVQPQDRPQTVAEMQDDLQLGPAVAMGQFNWREELGDIWSPDADRHASASGVLTDIDLSAGDASTQVLSATVPGDAAAGLLAQQAHTQGVDATLDVGQMTAPMPQRTIPLPSDAHGAAPRRPALQPLFPQSSTTQAPSTAPAHTSGSADGAVRWVVFGTLMVTAVALAGYVLFNAFGPTAGTSTTTAPTASAASVGASAASAARASPPGAEPAPARGPAGASAPTSTTPAATSSKAASAPWPAGQSSAVARPSATVPSAARPPARPDASAPGLAAPPPPAGVEPGTRPTEAPSALERSPRPVASPASAQPRPVAPPVVRPLPAAELCPDASLFSRPMCIHRECAKPELAQHPTCIEKRNREKEDSERLNAR